MTFLERVCQERAGAWLQPSTITASQLDACNGITSPTPEFPDGIYHYV